MSDEHYACECVSSADLHHSYNPGSGGELQGTVQSDGSIYNIYTAQRTNAPSIQGTASFTQFWSVRKDLRSEGTVTVGNHFDAWAKLGMTLGAHDYQIVATEGYMSSGTTTITVSEGTADSPEGNRPESSAAPASSVAAPASSAAAASSVAAAASPPPAYTPPTSETYSYAPTSSVAAPASSSAPYSYGSGLPSSGVAGLTGTGSAGYSSVYPTSGALYPVTSASPVEPTPPVEKPGVSSRNENTVERYALTIIVVRRLLLLRLDVVPRTHNCLTKIVVSRPTQTASFHRIASNRYLNSNINDGAISQPP